MEFMELKDMHSFSILKVMVYCLSGYPGDPMAYRA